MPVTLWGLKGLMRLVTIQGDWRNVSKKKVSSGTSEISQRIGFIISWRNDCVTRFYRESVIVNIPNLLMLDV